VLALAGPNLLGAALFGAVYAAGGARILNQPGFLAALLLAFILATVLWVRVERRWVGAGALGRVGRVAAGLAAVLAGVPVAVLLPLFYMESKLPPEAAGELPLAPVMFLVLVSLALVVLMNLVGAVAVLVARGRTPGAP
jgi:hypothetical protein